MVDWIEMISKNYYAAQTEIQEILDNTGTNLADKMLLLFNQQTDNGFIQDDLKEAKRFWVVNTNDRKKRAFLIQFNPRRAQRGKGSGRQVIPPGINYVNQGCFLCAENILWQQRGLEFGYHFQVNERGYNCYCNPFPLMPVHIIVASENHETQQWIDNGDKSRVSRIIDDMLSIVAQTPGFIAFYNGLGAGATIPGHLHYQFFQRPPGSVPYPLEKAAQIQVQAGHRIPFKIEQYPVTCIYFHGPKAEVLEQAVKCVDAWTQACANSPNLSANIISMLDETSPEEKFHVYIVPRDASFSISSGREGVVGGLEMLGEIVFSSLSEQKMIRKGQIDYDYAWRILQSVEAQAIQSFMEKIQHSLAL